MFLSKAAPADLADNSNGCTTKIQHIELSSAWTIEAASINLRPLIYIESSEFRSSDGSIKWRMCLDTCERKYNPLSVYYEDKTFVIPYLKMECDDPISVEYEIYSPSLHSINAPLIWKRSRCEFTKTTVKPFSEALELNQFYNLLGGILEYRNDSLTLTCKIKVIKRYNVLGNKKVGPPTPPVYGDLDLLRSGLNCDVIITTAGKREIQAHKLMLAFHSPVFRKMLASNEQDRTSFTRISIPAFDHDVVDEMVQFIYTGKSPKLGTMADRLLDAAGSYGLENLRVMCKKVLEANLLVESARQSMVLCEMDNDERTD